MITGPVNTNVQNGFGQNQFQTTGSVGNQFTNGMTPFQTNRFGQSVSNTQLGQGARLGGPLLRQPFSQFGGQRNGGGRMSMGSFGGNGNFGGMGQGGTNGMNRFGQQQTRFGQGGNGQVQTQTVDTQFQFTGPTGQTNAFGGQGGMRGQFNGGMRQTTFGGQGRFGDQGGFGGTGGGFNMQVRRITTTKKPEKENYRL